ncbi:MAG: hypothetical protein KAR08_00845 [Candidatus Heimdallarchaeota archaeon]|nr:hypothetical protein [Candidatus Heimdallarchaeota archaeon]
MTMLFKIGKDAVKQTLIDAAAGRFVVVGNQRQQKAADTAVGLNRLVEIFFKRESFSKGKGRNNGPVAGDVNISIELTVSAPAVADVAVLDNPDSTPLELQTALAGLKEAGSVADDSFDELSEIVFQILMDARNIYFGLGKGKVNGRWVSEISKDQPNQRGALVVLTGMIDLTFRVSEDVEGDTGEVFDSMSIETQFGNDTVQKTGIDIK